MVFSLCCLLHIITTSVPLIMFNIIHSSNCFPRDFFLPKLLCAFLVFSNQLCQLVLRCITVWRTEAWTRGSIWCHVSILSGFDVSSIDSFARKAVWPNIQQMKTRSSFLWRWDTSCRMLKTGQWSVSSETARHWGLQSRCMIVIESVYPANYKCSCVVFSSPSFIQFWSQEFLLLLQK
jgi:hypothetical protein